ncbi:hypothetical protein EDB86DRAFT_2969585 [Lactarius hatsudake]|nr:hypothetical protein EDB86DRAFT_2969585 [Lactarius hatsudake]
MAKVVTSGPQWTTDNRSTICLSLSSTCESRTRDLCPSGVVSRRAATRSGGSSAFGGTSAKRMFSVLRNMSSGFLRKSSGRSEVPGTHVLRRSLMRDQRTGYLPWLKGRSFMRESITKDASGTEIESVDVNRSGLVGYEWQCDPRKRVGQDLIRTIGGPCTSPHTIRIAKSLGSETRFQVCDRTLRHALRFSGSMDHPSYTTRIQSTSQSCRLYSTVWFTLRILITISGDYRLQGVEH